MIFHNALLYIQTTKLKMMQNSECVTVERYGQLLFDTFKCVCEIVAIVP